MRIEMIAAQVSKPVNIFRSDQSCIGNDLVTYLQFLKIFFKGMNISAPPFCILLVNFCNGSYSCGTTLDRHPLHVMLNTANAAHFFSAARTPRAAMDKHWQR